MSVRQQGQILVVAAWLLTGLVSIFVALRIYARLVLVSWFGLDDLFYMLAYAFFATFSITISVAGAYSGIGAVSNPEDDQIKALFWEGIGINLMMAGMVLAKCSLGFFLLRIVQESWQKVSIWAVMFLLIATSAAGCVSFWLQCRPVDYIWDRRIKGGVCNTYFADLLYTVASVCIFADFFFALFPWVVLWKVKMNRRDKILILSSLSLGVFAGAFGIIRTIGIGALADAGFTKASFLAAVWSVAEIAVTMVCIGIPVCLPVFRIMLGKRSSNYSNENRAARYSSSQSRRNELQGVRTSTMTGMARKMGITWTETVFPLDREERDDNVFQLEPGESQERIVGTERQDRV